MTKLKLNARIIGGAGIIVMVLVLGVPALLFLIGNGSDFELPANLVQPTGKFPKQGVFFLAIAGAVGLIFYIRYLKSRLKPA